MNRNVVLYIKNGSIPLGNDYTIFTELKTLRGMKNRYQKHNEFMASKGCEGYIVVPYSAWRAIYNTDDLIGKYPMNKLEVKNNDV